MTRKNLSFLLDWREFEEQCLGKSNDLILILQNFIDFCILHPREFFNLYSSVCSMYINLLMCCSSQRTSTYVQKKRVIEQQLPEGPNLHGGR